MNNKWTPFNPRQMNEEKTLSGEFYIYIHSVLLEIKINKERHFVLSNKGHHFWIFQHFSVSMLQLFVGQLMFVQVVSWSKQLLQKSSMKPAALKALATIPLFFANRSYIKQTHRSYCLWNHSLQAHSKLYNSDPGHHYNPRGTMCFSVYPHNAKAYFLIEFHSRHLSGAGLQHQLRDASSLTEINSNRHHPGTKAHPSARWWDDHPEELCLTSFTAVFGLYCHGPYDL